MKLILLFILLSSSYVFSDTMKTKDVLKKIESNSILWDESNAIHEDIKSKIRGINPDRKNFEEKQLNFFMDGYLGQLRTRYAQFKDEYLTKMKSFIHDGHKYMVVYDYVHSHSCQLHVYELKSCGKVICGKERDFNQVRKDTIKDKYCDILYGKR